MDYGNTIGEAFAYTKDGLLGNIGTWILLIILSVLPAIPFILIMVMFLVMLGPESAFTGTPGMAGAMPNWIVLATWFGIAFILAILLSAFYSGYTLKILRGIKPLPAVTGFMTLFTDGIKYFVIQFVYMIPALIVFCATVGPALLELITAAMAGGEMPTAPGIWLGMMGGILLTIVVAFICGLIALGGVVRFARTGSVGEGFNFSAILETIGKIGWGTYIIALIIMGIVIFVVTIVISIIPFVGGILQLILAPWIGVFSMRYICMLFDTAGGSTPSP